jgi:sugar-specific transcriptional regulator TrmB
MKITVTEAAKTWGIPRTRIYEKLNNGEMSRLADKRIDPAEMSRVFGKPKVYGKTHENVHSDKSVHSENALYLQKIAFLERESIALKERAERAEEREGRLLSQMDKMTDTMKLLEPPKEKIIEKPIKKSLFRRVFGG